MAFNPGDEAWMVVPGASDKGAGMHTVKIHEVRGEEVLITREAWTDENLMFSHCPNGWPFRALTPEDKVLLPANETESKVIDALKGEEGDGKAIVYRKDAKFKEGGVSDLVEMNQLNDAELARNLKEKFMDHIGWVRCGPTLVAMNLKAGYKVDWAFGDGTTLNCYPVDKEAGLLEKFRDQKSRADAPPHCWSLASSAYKMMFEPLTATHKKFDQALIITGESGAGKTWNTKNILDFLAFVGESELTQKMLATTPILEGWGNSNMPRNPDSSRFGKLYKVFFDKKTKKLTGCSITPYMLEKSRVSAQQRSERNFHIFYRMLCAPRNILEIDDVQGDQAKADKMVSNGAFTVPAGAAACEGKDMFWKEGNNVMLGLPQSKKDMCKLGNFEDYIYLRGGTKMSSQEYLRIYEDLPADWGPEGGAGSVPGQAERIYDDAMHMSATMAALYGFFTEEQVDTILKTTAGVLHLGNVEILGDEDRCPGVKMDGNSGKALQTAAELWQVDPEKLAVACCMRTIHLPKGDEQFPAESRNQGLILRDTVARFVYDKLFVFIIEQCSKFLAKDADPQRNVFLGVLDIFGFEFYENADLKPLDGAVVNGLDQLNINICNEMLQQVFVNVIFGLEQVTYDEQKVDFAFDSYSDNRHAVDFLSTNKGPLLVALAKPGDNKKTPGPDSDSFFMTELKKAAGSHFKSCKTKVWQDFDTLKGRKPFDGAHGGPYGIMKDGKNVSSEVNKDMDKKKMRGMCPAFGIIHYAADVSYDCRGWIEKDKSNPAKEMFDCFGSSHDTFFMCPTFSAPTSSAKAAGVTSQFCSSLNSLIQTLSMTDMSFVRCLKASNPLKKEVFQSALVLKQLKYTGMLDTLKIRRFGFPKRYGNQDFVDKFAIIAKKDNVQLKPEEGSDTEGIASDNASLIADHMQSKYSEEVFQELPESDRADPQIIAQKSKVVACGKPRDPKVTTPLVMLRDWFDQGMERRVEELLRDYADIAQASCAAAVNSKLLYGKKASGCKMIAAWFRALEGRTTYFMDKWKYLAGNARTQLAMALRAQLQRAAYARERSKKFEGVNRQFACGLVGATVQRQLYYEQKVKFLDQEMRKTVADNLVIQAEHARAFALEAVEEERCAQEEIANMRQEEVYAQELVMAAKLASIQKDKQKELDLAKVQWDKAQSRYAEIADELSDIEAMSDIFQTDKGKLMLHTMEQALIEQGRRWHNQQREKYGWPPYKRLRSQDDIARYHPAYPEAPVGGSLRAWREYLYGAVACEQMDELDAYQKEIDAEMVRKEEEHKRQASMAPHGEEYREAELALHIAKSSGDPEEIYKAEEQLDEARNARASMARQSSLMESRAPAEEESQLSPASKRYLKVALHCNQNPDEFTPEIQAALKRCVAKLLAVNTKTVRIG